MRIHKQSLGVLMLLTALVVHTESHADTYERYSQLLDSVADKATQQAKYDALVELADKITLFESPKLHELQDDPLFSEALSEMQVTLVEPFATPLTGPRLFSKRDTCRGYLSYLKMMWGSSKLTELPRLSQKAYDVYLGICPHKGGIKDE